MRRAIVLCGLLIVVLTAPGRFAHSGGALDPRVSEALSTLGADATMTVIVTLRARADLSQITASTRSARLYEVVRRLRQTASSSQVELLNLLVTWRQEGRVREIIPLWTPNAIVVTATADVIQELAGNPAVLSVTPNQQFQPARRVNMKANAPATAGVSAIRAPDLWALGYRGQGIVVANLDTGVDGTHPDLAAQWRGGTNSWYDPHGEHPSVPRDANGHGTWTMGIMVGRDSGGTQVGVAPDAKWIAVKIFSDAGMATTARIHQAFQWILDPDGNPNTDDAPHVVNSSWAFGNPGCYLEFQPDLQALRAAGILPVFSAGNYGPGSSTSASPGNNPEAFAVGAIDANNQIYSGSSRGPTNCGGPTRTFPALVAPGVSILTTDLYGGYYTATGTSVAAPHAAGALALLLTAFPNLTAGEQEAALLAGAADLGASGVDNTFGAGRVDARAAYNHVVSGGVVTATPTFADVPPSHWAWREIETMYDRGLTRGCQSSPLLYCPEGLVTRAQIAVFIVKARYGGTYTPPPASGVFADVPVAHWASAWIEKLYVEGITGGCGTNPLRYCPEDAVTREQAAVLLVRARHGATYIPPPASGIFADVPTGQWSARWIEQLYADGVTSGCMTNPLRYCPAALLRRAEMAVLLVKNFNLPLSP